MPPPDRQLPAPLAAIRDKVDQINTETPPGRPGLLPGADADTEDEITEEE